MVDAKRRMAYLRRTRKSQEQAYKYAKSKGFAGRRAVFLALYKEIKRQLQGKRKHVMMKPQTKKPAAVSKASLDMLKARKVVSPGRRVARKPTRKVVRKPICKPVRKVDRKPSRRPVHKIVRKPVSKRARIPVRRHPSKPKKERPKREKAPGYVYGEGVSAGLREKEARRYAWENATSDKKYHAVIRVFFKRYDKRSGKYVIETRSFELMSKRKMTCDGWVLKFLRMYDKPSFAEKYSNRVILREGKFAPKVVALKMYRKRRGWR